MKKIFFILLFLFIGLGAKSAGATTYYIDGAAGADVNDGLATTTPWMTLDKFVESARVHGDVGIAKRGTSTTTPNATLAMLSDGTFNDPIILTSSYRNEWSDFASSTQTATVTYGINEITMSASTTGIVVGNWVFVQGDDNALFSYEVTSVTTGGTNIVTLRQPYKGGQSGAGLTLNIMPPEPIIGDAANNNFAVAVASDDYWVLRGFDFKMRGGSYGLSIGATYGLYVKDCILSRNTPPIFNYGVGSPAYTVFDNVTVNAASAISITDCGNGIVGEFIARNSYFVATGDQTAEFFFESGGCAVNVTVSDSVIQLGSSRGYLITITSNNRHRFINNTYLPSSIQVSPFTNFGLVKDDVGLFIENYANQAGLNQKYTIGTSTWPTIHSTSTQVRAGGGASSIAVMPTNMLNTIWPLSALKLFDYPIYADTSNKQYTVYFNATSTADWTANPTAAELWIECEYQSASTGTTTRRIKKSTGTVDFAGSTAWQSLNVQCQPAVAGPLYLRGYYAKPKELGKLNQFFIDVAPVITAL